MTLNTQLRKKRILHSSCHSTIKVATLQNYITNYRLSDAVELIQGSGYSSDELTLFILMLAQESSQESFGGAA